MRSGRLVMIGLALCVSGVAGVAAQEVERPETQPDSGRQEPARWRNHAGGTLGLYSEKGASAPALGAAYERRLSPTYGAGAVLELALDAEREYMIAPAFFMHPVSNLRVMLAPGVEQSTSETAFVLRTAFDYPFPVSPPWTLTPLIALDFTRGRQIVVVGLTIGRTF